jgi:DNA-binding transcriptional LysR family regulator
MADLAGLPLVIPSHHLGIRGAIDDAVLRAGVSLDARMQADAPRLVRQLVADGAGYGILPACYCRDDLAAGRLQAMAIDDPAMAIGVYLSSRQGRLDRGRMGAVAAMLENFVRSALDGVTC